MSEEETIHILVVGGPGSGKTTFIQTFAQGSSPVSLEAESATEKSKIHIFAKPISTSLQIQFVDLGGAASTHLVPLFKTCTVCLVMCDVARQESLSDAVRWLTIAKKHLPQPAVKYGFVLTSFTSAEHVAHEVPLEDLKELAASHGIDRVGQINLGRQDAAKHVDNFVQDLLSGTSSGSPAGKTIDNKSELKTPMRDEHGVKVMLVEIYENQRINIRRTFVAPFIPGERKPWSSKDGKTELSKSDWKLQQGWTFADEWHVDGGDEEGWEYALDFPRTYSNTRTLISCVRRRRWIRTAKEVSVFRDAQQL